MSGVGRPLALLATCLALSACALACGSNSEAIARARALPPARLAQLANDLAALPDSFDAGHDRIPAAFGDLRPVRVQARGGGKLVHLSGCFDDRVLLVLQTASGRQRQLHLHDGNSHKVEVLWAAQ